MRVRARLCGSKPNRRLTLSKKSNLRLWHNVGHARGSGVALTALPVGPEPATETGATGDDHDADRAHDDDEPRHEET
jgi:hypothetical protein